MKRVVIEKVFLKQNEGVHVDSSCPFALYIIAEQDIAAFNALLNNDAFQPIFHPEQADIFASRTEVWNLVILFAEEGGKIKYSVTPLTTS